MSKLKINTFGEGIEIRHLHLDQKRYDLWSLMAQKRKKPLTDLLLDPFFYYGLKDKNISNLLDIEATLISGMLNSSKGQIEIWFDRHKVLKIPAHDLFNDLVLFPIFNSTTQDEIVASTLEPGLYVVQKTIGLLSSEHLVVDDCQFNIHDLHFVRDCFSSDHFISKVTYKNQNLECHKSDTVVIRQSAFEVFR